MKPLLPKLQQFDYCLKTIETHTAGEPTRIIYDGFPELKGETMMDKKQFLIDNYDHLRRAVMLEPRGHRDMFGALLTSPADSRADFGVIFMDAEGSLNMCGHGSIGVSTMAVETGLVEVKDDKAHIVLDTPSGLVTTLAEVENGRAKRVSVKNVPSFLYKQGLRTHLSNGRLVDYDIAFGGSFFALVDLDVLGISLSTSNLRYLIQIGMELKSIINKTVSISHPYLNISTVSLVEFYSHSSGHNSSFKNCVVFGDSQVDRSPCGTGTSAMLATLFAKQEIKFGQSYSFESILGTHFLGKVVEEINIDGIPAIIPEITGHANIIGNNEWLINNSDKAGKGFLLSPYSNRDILD